MARVVADLMEVVGISHLIARAKYVWVLRVMLEKCCPLLLGEVTR